MFTADDRERLRDRVLQMAASDARVVAGAVVGSLALGPGDRWSDLDLTFAVADDASPMDVLEEWTRDLVEEFQVAHLFDATSRASLYRVFLLPSCLQFDLSFTPAATFGATGPNFRMLFGQSVDKRHDPPPDARELLGHAVHHALRARICIERGRHWQAEHWISGTRDIAMSLACRRRGLPASSGRGLDDLPADVRDGFVGSLVQSLARQELMRALGEAIEGLLRESDEARDKASEVEPQLRRLMLAWDDEPASPAVASTIRPVVRQVVDRDAARLRELNREFNGVDRPWPVEDQRTGQEVVLVAECEAQVVGFACLQVLESACYPRPWAELTELYVTPAFRRRGVGAGLVTAAEGRAREARASELVLRTNASNEVARRFFAGVGLAATGNVVHRKGLDETP